MVIDDDAQFHELMEIVLKRRLAAEVVRYATGQISPEDLSRHRPDVIILDLVMPEISGWDLLKTLRQNEHTEGIPVLVLSAAVRELRAMAKELGAMPNTAYMEKPFEIDKLFDVLERLNSQASSSLATTAAEAPNAG